MPLGAQPRQGHAFPLDVESLPRLHTRLPLLLRAALPDAVRARARRRVLVAHLRETQFPRGPAARVGEAVMEARARRSRDGDRPVSADRGPLQAHTALARGAGGRAHAGRARDERADGRARCGSRSPSSDDVARCTVHISVPTVDEEAWAALEPGTAHPLQRLRAVRALRKAGVNAGVLMAPIVPGFTTERRRLEATIRAVAEHDAAFMGANVLYLKDGTKDHFMGFLRKEFPAPRRGVRAAVSGIVCAGGIRADGEGPRQRPASASRGRRPGVPEGR